MKEFKVLKLLDCFKKVFEKIGIDYEVMRKILQVKLVMDGRRVSTVIRNNKESNEETNNNFIKSLWIYVLMGLFNIIFIVMNKSDVAQMSFVFGIMMFMVMTTLIADFSSVLLDIREKNILLSKPVNSMTLNIAKIIHIIIYLSYITFAIAAPSLIASLITRGILFFLLFLVELILMDFFIIALTAFIYLSILRFFDGEKLKDIINYVQIGLSMIITIGYQFVGRAFNFSELNVSFQPKWWNYFICPIWFGAPFEVLLRGNTNTHLVIFAVLALMVPLFSIYLYIRLIPAFERSLQKLNGEGQKHGKNKDKLLYWVSNRVCFNEQERAFFRFASIMMKREREFKLRTYPGLGFALLFPFIFIISEVFDEGFANVASSNLYYNIYFCALFLPSVLLMLQYSAHYKGAWIYKVTPLDDIGVALKGCYKAFLIHRILPIYLFEAVIFQVIFGSRILIDLIIVFLNVILFSLICVKQILTKNPPFAKPFSQQQEENKGHAFMLILFQGILVGCHYGFRWSTIGLYVYGIILFVICIGLWKKSFVKK